MNFTVVATRDNKNMRAGVNLFYGRVFYEEVADSVRLGAGASKLYIVETTNTLAHEPSGLQGSWAPCYRSSLSNRSAPYRH